MNVRLNAKYILQVCVCRCISVNGILHICVYLSAASDSEYRFVTIVCECKFQHSTSDFYFTGFHIGAVSVNVHVQVQIFIVQVLKFTFTCSRVLLLIYLHSIMSIDLSKNICTELRK